MTSLDRGSRALEGIEWKWAVVDGAPVTVWRTTAPEEGQKAARIPEFKLWI